MYRRRHPNCVSFAAETLEARVLLSGSRLNATPALVSVEVGGGRAKAEPQVVSISQADLTLDEDGDHASIVMQRVGDTSKTLKVAFEALGQALPKTDYVKLPKSVKFAKGQSEVTLTIVPVDDNELEAAQESIAIQLVQKGKKYILGTPSSVEIQLNDNDQVLPVVTITASDASASEAGNQTGAFTISRTGSTTEALTIFLQLSGSATSGTDYSGIPQMAVIPAGQSQVILTLLPIGDADEEGTETATLQILPEANYEINGSGFASVQIADQPIITVTATVDETLEGSETAGQFRLTRTGSTSDTLTVQFELSGTATNGFDYSGVTGAVEFASGESVVFVPILSLADELPDSDETVILTLLDGAQYALGAQTTGTVTITELPVVSLEVNQNVVSEWGNNQAVLTISRTGSTTNDLTVHLGAVGTAVGGTDYVELPDTVVIPAGQSSVQVNVSPINDGTVEANDALVVSLVANSAYTIQSGMGSVPITIVDGLEGNYSGSYQGTVVDVLQEDPEPFDVSGLVQGVIDGLGQITISNPYDGTGAVDDNGETAFTSTGSLSGTVIDIQWTGSFTLSGTTVIGSGTWQIVDSGKYSGSGVWSVGRV